MSSTERQLDGKVVNRAKRTRRLVALFLFFVGIGGLSIALTSIVSDDMTSAPDGSLLLLAAGASVLILLGAVLFRLDPTGRSGF